MILVNFALGLAIFLYGMYELERGIRQFSDARLRYWLRHSTGTSIGSVATGVFTTALLQSSSMVSLIVLAFASAGILPLINSIGIILGANLGTTFTGWIVATLGFKLDLEAISLQLIAAGGVIIVLFSRLVRLRYLATAVVGLGLLLFGLGLMKTSMEALPELWNVSELQGQPAIVYLAAGIVLAALIQSSSAVMMMGLAALNANILALPEVAALIIGADLGTTSTTMLGSLAGGAIKKQLALAHFIFNLIVDLAAFVLLLPLLPALIALLTIEDPLYALVAFHTVINLLGLLVFVPFIKPFTRFVSKRVSQQDEAVSVLDKVAPVVSDAAVAALEQAVGELVIDATVISTLVTGTNAEAKHNEKNKPISTVNFKAGYEHLKQAEGEILRYALRAQEHPLTIEQTLAIDLLLRTTRSAVYAVKTLKDIEHNLGDLQYGEQKVMRELYDKQQQFIRQTSAELTSIMRDGHPVLFVQERLQELRNLNDQHHTAMIEFVHAHAQSLFTDDRTLSSELNVNREIHHSYKAFIEAIAELTNYNIKSI